MALFLLRHVLDGFHTGARALAPFQDGELAFVNPHRAILAGMIHPDHGFDIDRREPGAAGLGLRGMVASQQ